METQFKKIKELPPARRGGKRKPTAEGLAFQEKILTEQAYQLEGTYEKSEIDTITQRIRSAANRVGMKVSVVQDNGVISFQGYKPKEEESK